MSAYQYIHSDYKESYITQQTKLLSEITATELLLNTRYRSFEFIKEPTTPETHTITITLKAQPDEIFEDSVTIEFYLPKK